MSDTSARQFYVVGGTVPPESRSYIERKADRELYEHLRASNYCYVLTSRQMGKSSLMARAARRLKETKQVAVATLDLTRFGTDRGEDAAARWYYGIARSILRELGMDHDLRSWWREWEDVPPVQRLCEFFSDIVLSNISAPIVIFVDELDSTIGLSFSGDFFAAIRACYNDRALKPQFQRLTFALLGAARPSDLIPDLHRTPFNIGYQINLEDFTLEESLPLAGELPGDDEHRERLLRRVLWWTGGHPYLTQKTLSELAAQNLSGPDESSSVDDTVHRIFIDTPRHLADSHFAYVRKFLTAQTHILEEIKSTYRLVRLDSPGKGGVDDEPLSPVKSALKLSGLLKVNADGEMVVRNRIYERTFVDWEAGDAFYKIGEGRHASTQNIDSTSALSLKTAKVVLVGDSGVGKTGLGWRLAHGEFKEHSSTHGQQFWAFDQLGTVLDDGTRCEAVLWDLAGQPDYRLTHSLFLDDTDLALVLFDPTDNFDPLHGVEFWLKRLNSSRNSSMGDEGKTCQVILVGARADRGEMMLPDEELREFCRQRGIDGYVKTSALTGEGLNQLLRLMRESIPWEQKSTTVTTVTFKHIKDCVLGLKESAEQGRIIISPEELREHIEKSDAGWEFSDAEMMTAVGHLANYGYVRVLRTSKGEERVLLSPELLNNLASSFVLEARRNPKGLGSLEETRLLSGGYRFRELEDLSDEERGVLLDSAVLLFLEHNVCFRETLGAQTLLIFPALINQERPLLEEAETVDDYSYRLTGAVENVYASLVVQLGYTQTFTRTNQWQNHAEYETARGDVCGFRQTKEHEGETEFVLYHAKEKAGARLLFQGLFEEFLRGRDVTVMKFPPIDCPNCGYRQPRTEIVKRIGEQKDFLFCGDCGEKIVLPKAGERVVLSAAERMRIVEEQARTRMRTAFESAMVRVKAVVRDERKEAPSCFISYAWGDAAQERWVENLAKDLRNAGIDVALDKWETARVGSSAARFVGRIEKCDRVIVVGTPLYRRKFESKDATAGSVVASEVDLISLRLVGATEGEKATVLPVLLEGDAKASFPPLMRGKVYADFRDKRAYFSTVFDLMLSLYGIAFNHPAVADLRESLRHPDAP